jgi:hypothetical protein
MYVGSRHAEIRKLLALALAAHDAKAGKGK